MILNLTQHKATPSQVAAGVIDLSEDQRTALIGCLTFKTLPTTAEIKARAELVAYLATLVSAADKAMIGGAPFLMADLEVALQNKGITPLYSFSVREVVEEINPQTGVVTKTAKFEHLGFIDFEGEAS